MGTIILAFFKKFGGWVIAGFSFLGMLATLWVTGKRVGAANQQTADSDAIATRQINEAQASADTQVKVVENANNEQAKVTSLADGAAAAELLDKWSR